MKYQLPSGKNKNKQNTPNTNTKTPNNKNPKNYLVVQLTLSVTVFIFKQMEHTVKTVTKAGICSFLLL